MAGGGSFVAVGLLSKRPRETGQGFWYDLGGLDVIPDRGVVVPDGLVGSCLAEIKSVFSSKKKRTLFFIQTIRPFNPIGGAPA